MLTTTDSVIWRSVLEILVSKGPVIIFSDNCTYMKKTHYPPMVWVDCTVHLGFNKYHFAHLRLTPLRNPIYIVIVTMVPMLFQC